MGLLSGGPAPPGLPGALTGAHNSQRLGNAAGNNGQRRDVALRQGVLGAGTPHLLQPHGAGARHRVDPLQLATAQLPAHHGGSLGVPQPRGHSGPGAGARGDLQPPDAPALPLQQPQGLGNACNIEQRSCGCPIPGTVQARVGHRGLEQAALVEGVPARGRGCSWVSLKLLSPQTTL